jgi:hypothetical protein
LIWRASEEKDQSMTDGFFHLAYDLGETTDNAVNMGRPLRVAHDSTYEPVSERWHTRYNVRGNPLNEAWLAVLTKFGVLEVVTPRLGHNLDLLRQDLAANADRVRACAAAPDSAYPCMNKDLSILLVESVDAFIFQYRSAYEMVGEFVRQFSAAILDTRLTWVRPQVMEEIAKQIGSDTAWMRTLWRARHHFVHDRSPWIGVRDTPGSIPEVFILKSDTSTPFNPDDCLSVAQLQEIHRGFKHGVDECANWLVAKIRSLEAGTP